MSPTCQSFSFAAHSKSYAPRSSRKWIKRRESLCHVKPYKWPPHPLSLTYKWVQLPFSFVIHLTTSPPTDAKGEDKFSTRRVKLTRSNSKLQGKPRKSKETRNPNIRARGKAIVKDRRKNEGLRPPCQEPRQS
jgi:hypothetical protein